MKLCPLTFYYQEDLTHSSMCCLSRTTQLFSNHCQTVDRQPGQAFGRFVMLLSARENKSIDPVMNILHNSIYSDLQIFDRKNMSEWKSLLEPLMFMVSVTSDLIYVSEGISSD